MSKKLKILLIASLCLNALFLSLMAGQVYHHRMMMPHQAPLISMLQQSSLSEVKREELIAKLNTITKRKGKIKQHRKWHDETQSILTAESFDSDAYRTQLEGRFLKHAPPNKADTIDVMVEIASSLNLEERKKMADILKPRRKRKAH